MYSVKLSRTNEESLNEVFDVIEKQNEMRQILDNLQESILILNDTKVEFKNDTFN